MKIKVTIDQSDLKKLETAADSVGAEFGNARSVGKSLKVEIIAKSAATFYELGRLIDQITPEQVKQFEADQKAEAEAEAKAKKGSK